MSHNAFLQAIIAEPHRDDIRLIFADWLDDHGEADRAAFIRLQCELALLKPVVCKFCDGDGLSTGSPECRPCQSCDGKGLVVSKLAEQLRRRERELLRLNENYWRERCYPLAGRTGNDPDDSEWTIKIEWHRGFVASVSCSCADWMKHGQAIVAQCPLDGTPEKCGVILTDREPFPQGDQHSWQARTSKYGEHFDFTLPPCLFEQLESEPGFRQWIENIKWYTSKSKALQALSNACILWARSERKVTV